MSRRLSQMIEECKAELRLECGLEDVMRLEPLEVQCRESLAAIFSDVRFPNWTPGDYAQKHRYASMGILFEGDIKYPRIDDFTRMRQEEEVLVLCLFVRVQQPAELEGITRHSTQGQW